MSGLRARLSHDAAAMALGGKAVARAMQENGVEVLPVGSRGLFWLEPLLEMETSLGWQAFGPVSEGDLPAIVDAVRRGAPHPLSLGRIEDHPFLRAQTRLTFERCGTIDPVSLDAYASAGGIQGLKRAIDFGPARIVEEIAASGLRGRGGAGFPAAVKWSGAAAATCQEKYVVCNADEGDSGTYADRMLMEGDPFLLIEGMIIAGIAIGAAKGYIYIRSEYPHAITAMRRAVNVACDHGLLGKAVLGSAYAFDIEIRAGAGSYVCGEETALLESLEGRRGQVRAKPPLPVHHGLFGKPTVINNVLTLAAAPTILAKGGAFYHDFGRGRSRGTMPVQLAGDIRFGGLFETAFGPTLETLVSEAGGGTRSGRPIRAVQVGGPLGAYFPPALFDTPFDYEEFTKRGGLLGHGGIVVFNDTVDMAHQARFAMEFCAIESCGKCTPCRIGSVRGMETIDRILKEADNTGRIALLKDLCDVMRAGSLCALGGFVPYPVLSAIEHFPEDFAPRCL